MRLFDDIRLFNMTLVLFLLATIYTCSGMKSKNILTSFSGKYNLSSMTDDTFKLTSDAAKKLSRLGAAKGGDARASKLSAERRSEIARAAIQARWEKAGKIPLPQATHKGSFQKDFGIDVDCYVLNDESKSAFISK